MPQQWTKQRVVEAIQDRYVEGLPMIGARDKYLASAARRHWGTWSAAVVAAGVHINDGRPLRIKWSRQRVLEGLRAWCPPGLSPGPVKSIDNRLIHAARRYFGNLHSALVAAGILPPDAQSRPLEKWSRQRVIEEIQARHRESLPLHATWPGNRLLVRAARWHHGSWSRALVAAGIPSVPKPRQSWSKQHVIDALQAWDRQRRGGATGGVGASLARAIRRHFGSMQSALAAVVLGASGDEK